MASAAPSSSPASGNSFYPGASWIEAALAVTLVPLEEQGIFASALADGKILFRLLDRPETVVAEIHAHAEGLCGAALAPNGHSLFSAGEDGRLLHIASDGSVSEFASIDKAWLEQLTVHRSGLVAAAYKKTAILFDAEGKKLVEFSDHPSTIGGICFDPKGKRLACSHYNGVSLWWVGGGSEQKPQRLAWKGSHLDLGWSPNGKFLLTCMQENALHGWRVLDFADFAMSGYARKPRSFNWSADGKWLATSGSPGIVCWDCSGKGPMGRAALVLGQDNPEITTRVACHPAQPLVAAGTEHGNVYLARFEDERIVNLKTASSSEIMSLQWNPSGRYLLASAEDGSCYGWVFEG